MNELEREFIEFRGNHIFAAWHAPPEPSADAPLVLVCPALWEEQKHSYRFLVEVGDTLSAGGIPVLRFDYRGSGNSTGDAGQFMPADQVRDIQFMAEIARSRAPDRRLVLLGLRAGAVLGRLALQGSDRLAAEVLIDPVSSLAENLKAFARTQLFVHLGDDASRPVKPAAVLAALDKDQPASVGGYEIRPEWYREAKCAAIPALNASRCLSISVNPLGKMPQKQKTLNARLESDGQHVRQCAFTAPSLWIAHQARGYRPIAEEIRDYLSHPG